MLLEQLPALAHYFHIRPWELDLLTEYELEVFTHSIPKNEG